jgi:hypothetical protein
VNVRALTSRQRARSRDPGDLDRAESRSEGNDAARIPNASGGDEGTQRDDFDWMISQGLS